jgi:hypothetical protein
LLLHLARGFRHDVQGVTGAHGRLLYASFYGVGSGAWLR